ncbi:MAG TPA: VCBS repeat-containing protein [Phycisphaerae bacterium]|nr:VCBS repeat-containing protein [Phycisphaerae bacterium]HRW53371.1 VCBS repeat-containing protein [Phycisphaerae bacterium]
MRSIGVRCVLAGLVATALVSTGCTELFVFFGPGGPFGPGGSTTVTPTSNTIAAPIFSSQAIDPTLEATAGARVIVVADMDGDGLDDLVSGSNESQPIQLHMRTGAAVAYDTFSVAGGGPISEMTNLEVTDFDGDGNPDVAVLATDTGFTPVDGASIRGAVILLFAPDDPRDQLGWTEVTISQTFVIPGDATGMTAFAIADMNGDGLPDIVLGSNEVDNTDVIRLFLNPGGANARDGGAWTQAADVITLDVNLITDLDVADLDQDGDMDIVATFPTSATFNIRWLVNPLTEAGVAAAEAGNWERRILGQQSERDPDNQGGDAIALGDIDGDGDTDVAVAFATLSLVQWFENPGAPFIQQQTFPWSVYNLGQLVEGKSINQLQLVDLNMDGDLDAFVTASGNMVGFQRGSNVQDFWNGFSILATDPVADIGRTAFSDVNADGKLDIITPFDRDGVAQDSFLIFLRLSGN